MAGRGSRFSSAGYTTPKPFIKINNKPMIQVVVENIRPKGIDSRFIFICQKKHLDVYHGRELLHKLAPNCEIVEIDYITSGQLSSALLAREYINGSEPLLTANTDQFLEFNFTNYLEEVMSSDLDGSILTMKGNDPKWSYIEVSKISDLVERTAEKEVISDEATVGVYFFKKGSDFCEAAQRSILSNETVNGEYYICPIYNDLIRQGKKIGYCRIGGMHGLGTPEDLKEFLETPIAKNI